MLEVGRRKLDKLDLADRVQLITGDAESLPHEADSFDAITMAFGIRNVPDRGKALREMARVVRTGGRIAILELNEPQKGVMASLARFHMRVLVPRLGALLSGAREYRYLQESVAAFPPPEQFAEMMDDAGIEMIRTRGLTFGVCQLYLGRVKG
jgi:demethylmenaquinone methyltransferase/2-methoxy-6-polyprenyl-1,4-benzoquinol methylase